MKDIVISDAVKYIGADDKDLDLFESQYIVPNGVSYNSYVILDEKIAVMDTIDTRKTDEWKENLERVLDGRTPDYLVISHLEPDHAGTGKSEETPVTVYTRSDLEERLEAVRSETEKYQDDQAASQPSRYAAAEYVRNLWDRELNLIYSSIHREMDEAAAEAFRREEIEWIKKRDLAADKAGTKSTGTPAQSIEYVRTSASVTMDRCYELLENYGDYLESDKN